MNVQKLLIGFLLLLGCGQAFGKGKPVPPHPKFDRPLEEQIKELNQSKKLDPSKKTVCTITINSADEREVFYKYLGSSMNFIELASKAEPKVPDSDAKHWFDLSCRRGVKCDVLVVSGHYGGSFFGHSKHHLSTEKLTAHSCQETCSGVLDQPKEVFLYGCNTASGKEKDKRTAEEYSRVLVEHGYEPFHAERVAAIRYSPLGDESQTLARRNFPNSRIYGFKSTAPYGFRIRPALEKYFKKIKKIYANSGADFYDHFLKNLDQTPIIESQWESTMKAFQIRTVQGSPELERPMCILSESTAEAKRLIWVEEVINDQSRLQKYVYYLDHYFSHLEKIYGPGMLTEKTPKAVAVILKRIRGAKGAKETLFKHLSAPNGGMMGAKILILNLAERLGWIGPIEKSDLTRFIFLKDVLSVNSQKIGPKGALFFKDLYCGLDFKMNFRPGELSAPETWSPFFIKTLGCVSDHNPELIASLEKLYESHQEEGYLKLQIKEALDQLKGPLRSNHH